MRPGLLMILFSCVAINACKEVKTTNGPGSPAQTSSSGAGKKAATQVTGMTEVSLEELPQLTVSVDLGACIGKDRWYDPSTSGRPLAGAVSVTPNRDPKGEAEQPSPWVFDPTIDRAGDVVSTNGSNKWRLDRGDYTVEVIAYEVETLTKKSTLSIPKFGFQSANDIKYDVIGAWDAASSTCTISLKP